MNTQTIVQNNTAQANDQVLESGQEAVKAWQRGTKALGIGDQMAVFALAHAWDEVTFLAIINDRKGNFEKQFSFDLIDYVTKEVKNEDGSRDNKGTLARTTAICKRVFGIEVPDASIKQRINRALEVVKYIMGQGFAATDLEISTTGRISVPYTCLNDPPAEDASKNELKTWEVYKGETVELDGKKGHTIAELQRRARPKPANKGAQGADASRGASFVSSVSFVSATLKSLMDEKADAKMPAPNNDAKKLMFDLKTQLDAFFTADPMEVEKEDKKPGSQRKVA